MIRAAICTTKVSALLVLLQYLMCSPCVLIASAMRFKDSLEQQSYLKHASTLGNVELVYAGLDVLGSTPWKINRKIFDVVIQVWNSGERMGKLPPAVYDEPEPVPPENYETDLKVRSIHLQRQKGYMQAKANNHSDRCSVNYKIEIARAVSLILLLFVRMFFSLDVIISSWATRYIYRTISISAVARTPSRHI